MNDGNRTAWPMRLPARGHFARPFPQPSPGQLYNQVINHHHYLTQEEFSNRSFFQSGGGCLQHR